VAAILRRTRAPAAADEGILSLADGRLVLDPTSRRYTLADGSAGRLTPGETSLLLALARRPGAVLTREQLLEAVARRPEEVYERVVDVHVANLRKKLGDDAGAPWLIETIPTTGYRLVATRDAA
jgi:DNA-binding response OmpR family regulator